MTINFSLICQIRDFGSGQILQPGQLYGSPGFAKIAPWRLACRDNFVAKVPGQVTGRADAANVYSLNRRAVSLHTVQIRIRLTERLFKTRNGNIYKPIIFCYLLLNIGMCEGQLLCDRGISDTTAGVWVVTEIMPTCNITSEGLEYRVNYDLLLKDFNIGNGTVFKILFYINCKGEDFNYRVLNSDNEKFNEKFIGSIQSITEWTPAYIIRKNKQIPLILA